MKKAFVLGLALLMALLIAMPVMAGGGGQSGSAAGGKKAINIGVLVWKYDDAYGSTVRAGMTKWAKTFGDELGLTINLEMQDAGDIMSRQLEQAQIMFAKKPDIVIINLAEVASGQALVEIAQQNKVPFIWYNKEPTPETIKATVIDTKSIFIGTTPREAGDMQGEILADLYNKDKSIDKNGDGILQYVMFQGEPNNPEAIARTQYSVETAEKNGLKLQRLGPINVASWDQGTAQDQMVAAIAQFGADKIEVVFGNNDQMAMGAVAALNAVGYNTGGSAPKAVVIGVDAVDSALESIKAGGMTATVQQDGDAMGKANIRIAINGALGKPWLDGTDYKLSEDGYSIRIPYAKITN
ncbi:MAG: galactose ABC transporter substrate-binding protein [Treponema sp.]|nr:galactose ABC transporter substrate-binding protein [Treponema sp.]